MTDHLPPLDEELFRRIALGELDRDAPEALARAAESPALAAALEDLAALSGKLEGTRTQELAQLEAALQDISPEDRAEVRAALANLESPRPRRSRRAILTLAAAAVVLLLAGRAWMSSLDSDRGGRGGSGVLGPDGCTHPFEGVTGFDRFEVDTTLEPGLHLFIQVYDEQGGELLSSPRLATPAWQPSLAEQGVLETAGTIEWLYEVRDAGGESRVTGGPCRAWLLP